MEQQLHNPSHIISHQRETPLTQEQRKQRESKYKKINDDLNILYPLPPPPPPPMEQQLHNPSHRISHQRETPLTQEQRKQRESKYKKINDDLNILYPPPTPSTTV
jgi:DNA-binding protein H-NS